MNRRARLLVLLPAVVLFAPGSGPLPGAAAADPPKTAPKPLDPEQLARDLASDVFAVRERAARELWKMGEPARAALSKAAAGDDTEASARAKEILGKFDRGLYADTPADVVKLLGEYRSGDTARMQAAVTTLVRYRDKGVPFLRVLLKEQIPEGARGPIFEHLSTTLRHEIPRVLFDGHADTAEAMLSLNTLGTLTGGGTWAPGLVDYALLVHLRGRDKEVIADLEARKPIDDNVDLATKHALVFAYRAAGERKKAKALAEKLAADHPGDPHFRSVYDSLLEDLGAWDDLVARTDDAPANSADGLKMFRLRMAGKQAAADEIGDRAKDADGDGPGAVTVHPATMALMLNGRELDGIARMRDTQNAPQILADVLAARLQFKDALDKVGAGLDKAAENEKGSPFPLGSVLYGARKGRLLAQLGQRDAAVQVFTQIAAKMTDPQSESQFYQLIRAEVRAGLPDLAAAHLGAFLKTPGRNERDGQFGGSQNPFEALFDADAEAAQFWWRVLDANRPADEKPEDTMRKVRRLLTGKATRDETAAAFKAAKKEPVPDGDLAAEYSRGVGLAAAYRAAGMTAEAIAALTRTADVIAKPAADPANPDGDDDPDLGRRFGRGARSWIFGTDERVRLWLDLGDLLTARGDFKEAAARYEQGWKRFPDNPLPLYHSGRALVAAGDAKEGQRRIELSHWVALGNARVRGRFLEDLLDRGATADVRVERELIRETGWVSELFIGNVWNQVGRASVRLKDYDGAADATRRAIHYLLRTPGITYVEGFAYLTVPQAVRVHTARALVATGKPADVDRGVALAKDCLTVLPGNTEVPNGLVPMLDKLGRKKDADALFKQVWDVYAGLIADHPDSGWARYSAAWLAAGCHRELDAALVHAKKAVELDPDAKAYREALAEIHFRRGDRDKAVGLMKELAAADPRNHHFRRQLDRYFTAAFDSPLPEAADD